jgi:hypothetical protein
MKPVEIRGLAESACSVLKMRRTSFRPGAAESLLASLEDRGIHVDVVDDSEWLNATRATVDPQRGMIYMPSRLHDSFCRGRADAVRIVLHEIGHIVLGHRPLMHFAETRPARQEDSEWQADYFADSIIELLGLEREELQMELEF